MHICIQSRLVGRAGRGTCRTCTRKATAGLRGGQLWREKPSRCIMKTLYERHDNLYCPISVPAEPAGGASDVSGGVLNGRKKNGKRSTPTSGSSTAERHLPGARRSDTRWSK